MRVFGQSQLVQRVFNGFQLVFNWVSISTSSIGFQLVMRSNCFQLNWVLIPTIGSNAFFGQSQLVQRVFNGFQLVFNQFNQFNWFSTGNEVHWVLIPIQCVFSDNLNWSNGFSMGFNWFSTGFQSQPVQLVFNW